MDSLHIPWIHVVLSDSQNETSSEDLCPQGACVLIVTRLTVSISSPTCDGVGGERERSWMKIKIWQACFPHCKTLKGICGCIDRRTGSFYPTCNRRIGLNFWIFEWWNYDFLSLLATIGLGCCQIFSYTFISLLPSWIAHPPYPPDMAAEG